MARGGRTGHHCRVSRGVEVTCTSLKLQVCTPGVIVVMTGDIGDGCDCMCEQSLGILVNCASVNSVCLRASEWVRYERMIG